MPSSHKTAICTRDIISYVPIDVFVCTLLHRQLHDILMFFATVLPC